MNLQSSDIITENLYEIPSCSICLNQLTEDLASLACGHVFHISCITQHFQYKGSCPNCQKRAMIKEIRLVVFPVVHNTKATTYLRALIQNIGKSQGQQVQGLLAQLKRLSEKQERLQNSNRQAEKDIKKKSEQIQKLKREIESRLIEIANLRKQSINLARQLTQQKQEKDRIQANLIQLSCSYDVILKQKKQIEQYKIIQKLANQSSQQLLKYKNQLESQSKQPAQIAKSFFEMLQLKNLSTLKMREKQKQYAEKYKYKEDQNFKLKNQITALKKQIQDGQAEVAKWKAKYEKLRDRYKQVHEKLRLKTQEEGGVAGTAHEANQQNSLSISLGLINRVGAKANTALSAEKNDKQHLTFNFNFIEKPKPSQTKYSFGNQALKKIPEDNKKQTTLKNFIN